MFQVKIRPLLSGGENDVAGAFHNAGQVAFEAPQVLAQADLFGDVFHEEDGALDGPLPGKRKNHVIIDPEGQSRGAIGQTLAACGAIFLDHLPYSPRDVDVVQDYGREHGFQALPMVFSMLLLLFCRKF